MSPSSTIPSYKLNTGATIPGIALGTWESTDEDAYNAVKHAIQSGYRHIDTAAIYGNEEAVGRGIRDSGVPRSELFITTKLWSGDQSDPEKALESSLKRLGLDYVDLYLIHWPIALKNDSNGKQQIDESITFVETYAKVQGLSREKARAIGVSNFDIQNLTRLLNAPSTKTVPAVNQVELHLDLKQQKLIDFCHSKDIVVEAYSPLGRGKVDNPVVQEIAKKHGVTEANVILSWNLQRGVVVLPKSVTPARIASNLKFVKLDKSEIDQLEKLEDKNNLIRHCRLGSSHGVDVFHGDVDAKAD